MRHLVAVGRPLFQCHLEMAQALATERQVAQSFVQLTIQGGEELLNGRAEIFHETLTRVGGQMVHEDAQQSPCPAAEEAEAAGPGDALGQRLFQLLLGLLRSGRLLLQQGGIGLGGIAAEANKASQRRLRRGHAPSRMLHQGEGRLGQAGIPLGGEFLRRRFQGAAQPALAPLAGLAHRAGRQTGPGPFAHPRHRLPRPVAGVIISYRLLRLVLQRGQQPRQRFAGRAVQ